MIHKNSVSVQQRINKAEREMRNNTDNFQLERVTVLASHFANVFQSL